MSGTADRNRENPVEASGPVDRALDRDRDDTMDVLEGGADRDATRRAAGTTDQTRADRGEIAIPVAEERLQVETRQAELGEVQVRKTVTEEQVSVPVELTREEVHVEQRDVADRPVQAGDDLFQEGTIRVPVRGEEAVVSKEAVVTGEVVIDKERTTERQEITETVRKEQVEVDENYRRARSGFQQHFEQGQRTRQRQTRTRTFEEAEPHYQYGYTAASGEQYRGREFEDVEPDLRRDYEARRRSSATRSSGAGDGDDAWEQLREEVREGWNRARSQ